MAVKSIKMTAEEVRKRERALLSVASKVESESPGNDVVICRKECRVFYSRNKQRIIKAGSTKKQAMWLALSEYCLEKRTELV
jgi:hypothetical protein